MYIYVYICVYIYIYIYMYIYIHLHAYIRIHICMLALFVLMPFWLVCIHCVEIGFCDTFVIIFVIKHHHHQGQIVPHKWVGTIPVLVPMNNPPMVEEDQQQQQQQQFQNQEEIHQNAYQVCVFIHSSNLLYTYICIYISVHMYV
jgi:hypothetical protein